MIYVNTVINGLLSMRRLVAIALAALIAMSTFALPANAETAGQTSTRNLILAGLAATAAVILYNNYHHKYEAAHTVVGYTRDGGTVYADGRVVYPDGTTLYTGNQNGTRCSYTGYYTPCSGQVYAYGPPGRGHHYGWYKHQGNQDDQGDDNGGDGGGDRG
jgi:hypothetical protein